MAEDIVKVSKAAFRSPMVPIAAVMCCLAALLGLGSGGLLIFPDPWMC